MALVDPSNEMGNTADQPLLRSAVDVSGEPRVVAQDNSRIGNPHVGSGRAVGCVLDPKRTRGSHQSQTPEPRQDEAPFMRR
jgi:hypothetical protein